MREVKDKQLGLAMTNFSLRDSDQEKRRQERRDKKLQTCEAESETLKRSNDNLRLHLDTLLAKVDELFQEKETEAGTNKLLKEENRHLQSLVEVLKNPAEQFQGLSSKVDNLMTRMEREQKRKDDELHTLRNVNQKISKRNLQLQEELDVQRKENTNSAKIILSLQAKNRTIHDNMTGLQLEIAHATQNHTSAEVVQTELNEVQAQVDGLKAKLALAVTELDCSGADMRIFTCKHESYTWVSDATKRTQGKDYVWIANDIFRAFGNDPVFLQEYETLRRSIIQHHRAHESTGLGRGAWATNIRNHCESSNNLLAYGSLTTPVRNVDAHWSRAIAISY
jgi:predicted RNase H-like nuclease (RuvC/YqgF family)